MTTYRDTETGATLSEAQIRAYFPNTSFALPFTPPDGYEAVAPTAEELALAFRDQVVVAVQARLDAFARTRGYDGILSAASYAGDPAERFDTEGSYAKAARSSTWATLYQVMAEVEASQRPVPADYAEVEALLPALAWPN